MGAVHRPTQPYQNKVKSGGALRALLANAQLQAENKAFEVVSRPQGVLADINAVCLRAKDL